MRVIAFAVGLVGLVAAVPDAEGSQVRLEREAREALRRAAGFYVNEVAHHGGYVYYYSPDLSRCWGEGETTREVIWVQPPGTPTVGMAYLRAHEATGEALYLEAARAAAHALVYGQLESGGWTNRVCFAPAKRMGKYRNGRGDDWNQTSLDDGVTQSALRFLIQADAALAFEDKRIHEAAGYALGALLDHQFPNGAFAQGWDDDPQPRPKPREAQYPDYNWRTEGRIKNYWDLYTLNDDNAVYLAEVLIEAHRVYGDHKYRVALERLGDFLILAQMPEPQPAWAQQYRYDMQPAWARQFEPPAISSAESMGVLETLIRIHRHTGAEKYLEPVPAALAYLQRSRLADGRLARYYELRTNKPLYMVRKGGSEYVLTHDDSDLPRHYGWKVESRLAEIEGQYERARRGQSEPDGPTARELRREVRAIIAALDDEGRWISRATGERLVGQPRFEPGQAYISSAVFAGNVETLSRFLKLQERDGR